jgi:hypothetical protein
MAYAAQQLVKKMGYGNYWLNNIKSALMDNTIGLWIY